MTVSVKECKQCLQELPMESFNYKNKQKGILCNTCKTCQDFNRNNDLKSCDKCNQLLPLNNFEFEKNSNTHKSRICNCCINSSKTKDTKKCTKCKNILPIDSFAFKNKQKGYRYSVCKCCDKSSKNDTKVESNKTCSCCKRSLPLSSFAFKNKAKGLLHSSCNECKVEYRSRHYQDNKSDYIEKSIKNNKIYSERNHEIFKNFLHNKKCSKCGSESSVKPYNSYTITGMTVNAAVSKGISSKELLKTLSRSDLYCDKCAKKYSDATSRGHYVKPQPGVFGYSGLHNAWYKKDESVNEDSAHTSTRLCCII